MQWRRRRRQVEEKPMGRFRQLLTEVFQGPRERQRPQTDRVEPHAPPRRQREKLFPMF